ncbi:MAG: hypothetical protein GY862_08205 [Gammaproteobacteria bacterium]|nr:hypothetical protein [Gammaproteobacteria bacterium]
MKNIIHILFLAALCSPAAMAVNSAIDAVDRYAWAENAGWFNFADATDGVQVYADHLEGYAWAENSGWFRLGAYAGGGDHTYLNTSSTDYGVNRDGDGNLSGYAWSETIGWIDFNPTGGGVSIDARGIFDGYAWSENAGWIHFQNTATPVYRVRILNDAPVLDNSGAPNFARINEDDFTNSGDLVSNMIASILPAPPDLITDTDTGNPEGIAVTSVDNSNGAWQYSTNNGTEWADFAAVSDDAAVLLASDADTRIRFVPAADFYGTVAGFGFRAWDQTDTNANGAIGINVSANGSNTAYSSAVETADIVVSPTTYSVTTEKTGAGSGTMSGDGIYVADTVVTLTATADIGNAFIGWTPVSCADSFNLTEDIVCTAEFAINDYTLTVNTSGSGTGSGVTAGGGVFPFDSSVTPTAIANQGSTFTGWTPVSCADSFSLTEDTVCTAEFALNDYTLTVNAGGIGSGTVSGGGTFPYNASVTPAAIAGEESVFVGWTPAGCADSFNLTGDTVCTAEFALIMHTLTVNKSGMGAVTSGVLQEIDCGIICNRAFPEGSTVTLSAQADPYWKFVTWGDACADAGGEPASSVQITAALSCTATFDVHIHQTAEKFQEMPLELFSFFEARHIAQIAPETIAALNAAQIAKLTYDAIGGLTREQIAAIADETWSGLTSDNMGGFSPAVIPELASDDLSAFDKDEFKKISAKNIAKFFVNIDCNKISPEFMVDFVPDGWTFNLDTLVLLPPEPAELVLVSLPPPEGLAENIELPEMPDLNIVFGLGNCGKGNTFVVEINETLGQVEGLEGFIVQQQEDGILTVTGSDGSEGLNLALMADADSIGVTPDANAAGPVSVAITQEGKVLFTTPSGFQIPTIPAPKSMTALAKAAGSDGSVKLGKDGEVFLKYRNNDQRLRQAAFIQEVVVFDPFIESPPEGICGDIDCGTGVYVNPAPETPSGIIYPDNTFQRIMPAVASPDVFTDTMSQSVPIDDIAPNVNGKFGVSYQGRPAQLTPEFGSQSRLLVQDERVEPSVAIQADGAGLAYTLQNGAQAITTSVSIPPPIQAMVRHPEIFIKKIMELDIVDDVRLNSDRTFDVFFGRQKVQKYLAMPTFEIQSIPVSAPVTPSVDFDADGKIVYTIQTGANTAIATKLLGSFITATVPSSPGIFVDTVRVLYGLETTPNMDGSFIVVLSAEKRYLVTPTFELETKGLAPGEVVLPAIAGNPDGTIGYTVQQGNQAVTARLLISPAP